MIDRQLRRPCVDGLEKGQTNDKPGAEALLVPSTTHKYSPDPEYIEN